MTVSSQIAESLLDERNRKQRRKWVREWISRRFLGASAHLLKELASEDPIAYRNILRLSPEKFEELLEMVSLMIQKKDTPMRMAVPSRVKLEITLRYIASGDSLMSLEYWFRVPHNTIANFLAGVLKAIFNALEDFIKVCMHLSLPFMF